MKILNYFNKRDIVLWVSSVTIIIASQIISSGENILSVIASLIGVTSLIFCAKGNPVGQVLMIIFSLLYGVISYGFQYYGEMITYLGMTAPMAAISLVSWLKNPFKGKKSEVEVNSITGKEFVFSLFLTAVVTIVFYFILKYFNTPNLIPSTISVATSFLAAYLTFRRSPYLSVAYALNDIVLIILWVMATLTDKAYLSVAICFMVFFVNDIYCFISWIKMKKRQKADLLNNSSVV